MESTEVQNGKRAFITGITGQDGSYLTELLLDKGYEVWGMVRRASTSNTSRIDHLLKDAAYEDRLHLVEGDMTDATSINRALQTIVPHEIYNLAAQSNVKVSFDVPEATGDINAMGPLRVLEAIRMLGLTSKFYQASSSEIYGRVLEVPQRESTPPYPRSPYGIAKAFGYLITRNYRESYGLFATNGILFNHESPRRGTGFVTRKITKAVAEISCGKKDCLHLGNLGAMRDWGFAGDYVEAIWQMMQLDEADDYVIATGENHSVREFCELAFGHVGIDIKWQGTGLDEVGVDHDGRVLVRVDPKFFRAAEVDELLGDAAKAEEKLGWKPRTSFKELVRIMIESDLQALQGHEQLASTNTAARRPA